MRGAPAALSPALVSGIRDELRAAYGGTPHAGEAGERERLEAALTRPRERAGEPNANLHRLAAAHAFGIARDRPLRDGNNRLALTLAGVFLELNGWRLEAAEADAASVTLALSAGELDEGAYAMWLEESCVRVRPGTSAGR